MHFQGCRSYIWTTVLGPLVLLLKHGCLLQLPFLFSKDCVNVAQAGITLLTLRHHAFSPGSLSAWLAVAAASAASVSVTDLLAELPQCAVCI